MNDTTKTTNDDGMDAINAGENRTADAGADNMGKGHDDGMKSADAEETAPEVVEPEDGVEEGSDDEGANRPDQTGQ